MLHILPCLWRLIIICLFLCHVRLYSNKTWKSINILSGECFCKSLLVSSGNVNLLGLILNIIYRFFFFYLLHIACAGSCWDLPLQMLTVSGSYPVLLTAWEINQAACFLLSVTCDCEMICEVGELTVLPAGTTNFMNESECGTIHYPFCWRWALTVEIPKH